MSLCPHTGSHNANIFLLLCLIIILYWIPFHSSIELCLLFWDCHHAFGFNDLNECFHNFHIESVKRLLPCLVTVIFKDSFLYCSQDYICWWYFVFGWLCQCRLIWTQFLYWSALFLYRSFHLNKLLYGPDFFRIALPSWEYPLMDFVIVYGGSWSFLVIDITVNILPLKNITIFFTCWELKDTPRLMCLTLMTISTSLLVSY